VLGLDRVIKADLYDQVAMPSTEPFHERVAANLRSQIAAGELGVGDPIPVTVVS